MEIRTLGSESGHQKLVTAPFKSIADALSLTNGDILKQRLPS